MAISSSSPGGRRREARVGGSLRTRIVLRITAATAVVLLTAGVALDRVVEMRLQADFDRALLARARALATLTELDHDGRHDLAFDDEVMPEFSRRDAPDYFQVWVEGGHSLERSRSLGRVDLPRVSPVGASSLYADLVLPDGRAGRSVQLEYAPQIASRERASEAGSAAPPPSGRTATVVVATTRAPLERSIADVRRVAAIALGVVLSLLFAVGLWAVADGLAPLAALARAIAAIGPEDLDRRLDVVDSPLEVRPLVGRLNELLERMARGFERERRISRNLAHELRTPIAELRTLADVGGRWPDDPEAMRVFADDVRAVAIGMERTVTALLSLARAEAGNLTSRRDVVALRAVAEAAQRRVATEARQRAIAISLDFEDDLVVTSDAAQLELVLGNLVENAVLHSPPGSAVSIRGRGFGAASAIVEIGNPAPELTAGDLPHLGERFWRKEEARQIGRHAGLGLSLAAVVAAALGGEIQPRLEPDGRLVMRVVLPVGR